MTISDSKPVSAIMTTTPVVANQFTNFSQVLTLFSEYPVRHLPIVDGKNNLIGIVSVNDLTKVFVNLCNRPDPIFMTLDNIDKAINIKDIMTPNPVT
ncbi:MAG TPA: CBS domain-containing protein, partial [Chitinophagales bacterium]|nr:CBS domain-containing protein [Chitinophagales bacterium]